MTQARQRIRFLVTDDGTKVAWAEAGTGPVVVKAANWMSHLEYEWESPVWRHWLRFFTDHFRYIRYDERGCGLTDPETGELSVDRWTKDLEAVIEAARPAGPVALLGMSQGAAACIAYAVRHPERVSRMVLYGAYARGAFYRDTPELEREWRLIFDAIRVGWGKDNPAFRQLFTSRFIPEGTAEQIGWFNELCRKTASPEAAMKLMAMRGRTDVTDLLEQVRVPTLVMHAAGDNIVPVSEGRAVASGIPGAEFIELESRNHVILEHEPAWQRFQHAVLDFFDLGAPKTETERFSSLSPREREVLALIAEGYGNEQISERLAISQKTVRNHISSVYDKLGVWTRAQAIVVARDHAFRA